MVDEWADFFVACAGAAAALTGLLLIAVSLRPAEIRSSPLMIGRARSAFYAFATITLESLLALAATASRLLGVAELLIAATVLGLSASFTLPAARSGHLNYTRAGVYHAGLVVVAIAGAVRAVGADHRAAHWLLATGLVLLLGISMSNSWQLVLTHGAD